MNAQDLKNSILQLAIQGKLVEQRNEEGTAEDLYQKIQEEKQRLIEEGEIKKQKKLPEITGEEIPFEIPDTWKWVRLGEITHDWGQKKPEKAFDYIDVSSINNIKGTLNNTINLVQPENAPSRARKIIKNKTVLYSTVRPYLLNICVINKEFEHEPIASTGFAVLHPYKGLISEFLYYLLRGPFFVSYVNEKMKGVAYPAINDKNLFSGLVPLPPYEEQKRIVMKIDKLMPLVERYGEADTAVTELNENFPFEMEKSILQYAIQGKLVEQREEEGTAEELYQQIQEEKQRLIEEGKIKKQKKLPEITEEEVPFEIPDTWKWVRIGDIIKFDLGGGTPSRQNPSYWNGNLPWMTVKDYALNPDGIKKTLECITEEGLEKSSTNFIPKNNVIVCTRVGLGNIAINDIDITINQDLRALFFSQHINKSYFIYYYQRLNLTGTGTTVKGIKREELLNQILPLPPLEEQKRIVSKIDEILPYTNQLSN